MTAKYHNEFDQGSGDWIAARCGMLTASDVSKILTPTLKVASNDAERQHLFELLAQRINKHVEPQFVGDAMLRGQTEELSARDLYSEKYAAVTQCGFITNDKWWDFTIGYSPDGLVGADGLVEIKSRRQKYQMQTIVDGIVPPEFMLQIQTGLLVSERKWCDFVSYSNGMPMFVKRVLPNDAIQCAIIAAAEALETKLRVRAAQYHANSKNFHVAPRRDDQEMFA